MLPQNRDIVCSYLHDDKNIIQLLPLEIFVKILKLAVDDRTTLEKLVEKHLDKPWCWVFNGLSRNPAITPGFVEKHPDQAWHWGIGGFSSNPSITAKFIEQHLNKEWEWGEYGLSSNPSITPEFVEKHLDQAWDWGIGG